MHQLSHLTPDLFWDFPTLFLGQGWRHLWCSPTFKRFLGYSQTFTSIFVQLPQWRERFNQGEACWRVWSLCYHVRSCVFQADVMLCFILIWSKRTPWHSCTRVPSVHSFHRILKLFVIARFIFLHQLMLVNIMQAVLCFSLILNIIFSPSLVRTHMGGGLELFIVWLHCHKHSLLLFFLFEKSTFCDPTRCLYIFNVMYC